MVVVWVFLGVAALAVEAAISTAFFAFFLAIGFGGGAIADTFGAPIWLQFMIVAAVAVLGIALLRPWLVGRTGAASRPDTPGGGDLVGQEALTVDEVGDALHPGHALLAGERWLAMSEGREPLPPDVPVVITAVRGTTLVVRPVVAAAPH